MRNKKIHSFFLTIGFHHRTTWLIIWALFITTFFAGCHDEKKEVQAPVDVTAMKVEPETVPVTIEYVGQTQSSHMVEIRARVEGYLDEIAYKEGSLVNEGDLLFQIDPRPFRRTSAANRGATCSAC